VTDADVRVLQGLNRLRALKLPIVGLTAVIYTHLDAEDLRDAVEALPSLSKPVEDAAEAREDGRKMPLESEGVERARTPAAATACRATGSDGTPGGIRTPDFQIRSLKAGRRKPLSDQ